MTEELNVRDERRPVYVVIPFYGDRSVVEPLLNSLEQCGAELQALRCSVLLVDDSGGGVHSGPVPKTLLGRLGSIVPCEHVRNAENLGFVRSANIGLQRAIQSKQDCVLLNSDTVVFPGALSEMQAVGYSDAAIGFVNPRSNNATICSLPHQDCNSRVTAEAAFGSYAALAPRLARLQFVPTCVGFCMFVKHETLAKIGVFDEIYGRGYNEENDLVMRGNRVGYCAVIANRAFVYHRGGASFIDEAKRLEKKNAVILDSRYPEYRPAVNSYYASPQYRAELLLYDGLLRDSPRPRIALLRSTGSHAELTGALSQRFDVEILSAGAVTTRTFAAAVGVDPVREMVLAAVRLAPVTAFLVSETSFFDRLTSRAEGERTWRLIARTADIVCAANLSQMSARLTTNVTGTPLDALPEAIAKAIDQFTVAGIVERFIATEASAKSDMVTQLEAPSNRIVEVRRSFSWRVTSPVRRIYRAVSGLLGRPPVR